MKPGEAEMPHPPWGYKAPMRLGRSAGGDGRDGQPPGGFAPRAALLVVALAEEGRVLDEAAPALAEVLLLGVEGDDDVRGVAERCLDVDLERACLVGTGEVAEDAVL